MNIVSGLARTAAASARGSSSLRVRGLATAVEEVRLAPLLHSRPLTCQNLFKLRRTGLHDFHVENGAKMVPFAGYSMPLSYGAVGAIASHNHVRESVGLFDVGHMMQTKYVPVSSPCYFI